MNYSGKDRSAFWLAQFGKDLNPKFDDAGRGRNAPVAMAVFNGLSQVL